MAGLIVVHETVKMQLPAMIDTKPRGPERQ